MRATRLALAALLLVAWFPSGEKVVEEVALRRQARAPVRVELLVALAGDETEPPLRLTVELHPDYGLRAALADGSGRWIYQRGRIFAGAPSKPPAWLPDLEPLGLRTSADLHAWMSARGIDPSRNELARCGDADCYVLGTRASPAQLWIDKDKLEVRKVVSSGGLATELGDWKLYGSVRFPGSVRVTQGSKLLATAGLASAAPAPDLAGKDWSPDWVRRLPATPGR